MYAAGILPISRANGRVLFLVGKGYDGGWSDFGGRSEREDRGCSINTAIREFYEEALGCFGNLQGLRKRMLRGNCVPIRGFTQNGHPYTMFVVEIPFEERIGDIYANVASFITHEFQGTRIEKKEIAWVTLEDLLSMPMRSAFRSTVQTNVNLLERISKDPWETVSNLKRARFAEN
jgi:hypothetical protein